MTINKFLVSAAAVLLACPQFLSVRARADSGGGYAGLAAKVTGAALERRLNRVAIDSFTPHEGALQAEAERVQKLFSEALFSLKSVAVMDSESLAGIRPRGPAWAEVVIRGFVYGAGGRHTLVLKAVLRATGSVILTLQSDVAAKEDPASTLSGSPADLRDAPNSPRSPDCPRRLKELRDWNDSHVDLKARYWALKMREPGFSYGGRETQPGGELEGYATIQKFYRLVNEYYGLDSPVPMNQDEAGMAEDFMERERETRDKCRTTAR